MALSRDPRAAWVQAERVTFRPLGHQRGRATGHHQAVLRLRTGALGQRRGGRGAHAALPAGVDVLPVPVRAGGAAGASTEDKTTSAGVLRAERTGDAAGES